MDNRYFVELNGYLVKDKEARENLEVLNTLISNANYHFINTGDYSGDCILLELPTKNYLIDVSGNTSSTPLVNYLNNNNISKIDGIIISHYHGDHVGGASAEGLVEFINSGFVTSNTVVYLPTDPDYSSFTDDESDVVVRIQTIRTNILNACTTKGLTVEHMETNDTIEDSGIILRFLNSDSESFSNYYDVLVDSNNDVTTHTNYNNFSMVVQVENLNNTILLTGDIELAAQTQLEKYLKRKITLKKVEHHGLNHLSDSNYLKKSSSDINVVMNTIDYDTNSNGGRYESFSYMIKNGDKIFSTQDNGSMVFIDNGYSITYDDNLISEEFNQPNGVVGMIATGTNTFKNLGEPSYRNFIKSNDDLDDYIIPGDYVCTTSAIASTISNTPIDTTGFKLIVEYSINKERIIQTIIRNDTNIEIYVRYKTTTWGAWEKLLYSSHAQARITGTPSFSSATDWTHIPLSLIEFNTSKFTLDTNHDIKVGFKGVYQVTGFVGLSGVTANDKINVGIYVNGTRKVRFYLVAGFTSCFLPIPPVLLNLYANDTIQLYIKNETSGTFTIDANNGIVVNEV